ncbi:coniferyl aldehyde dehydrogenase [Thioalkalivibrio sp. XN8]|uniref:coniferyl aldehyde dehydrogenase n=1 Tax=Thioalkalivibrio sp. XN8 TaxID=2712863 RepID=UPI0013EDD03E|nr:coniferyl aldehyde dehydrogenase [Thioalkalivibrio sp. XN8]NGP52032.1 coniferyl aldehyde dehydrogenase [Thioalkalivibrio sp. XN8]
MAAEPTDIAEQQQIARMRRLFDAQQAAFGAAPMPTLAARKADLKRLKDVLIANRERLVAAVSTDFGGRAGPETQAEILAVVHHIKYCLRRLRRWMKPQRRSTSLLMATTRAMVYYQPLGVVGVVVPWNYPIALSAGPLVFALAAGNRVMIKMSETTPRTAELMRHLLSEAFEERQVAVVLGEAQTAREFTRLPFDHLLYTGGSEVGRLVMKEAAANLTPVTLELGGKSPTLISEDVPMDLAAERICFGKALNAGQTCVAPDYVLCPAGRVDEFIAAFGKHLAKMYPGLVRNSDYSAVVNERHYRRLRGYIDDARERGGEVIELNPGGLSPETGSRKLPLYLVKNATAEMRVMKEEIFGPVLPIVAYNHLQEAIDFINARPRPLALNLFDFNPERRERVLAETHAGGVCINDAVSQFIAEDLPFGGVGESGMGHYHGYEGFLTFSHAKAVFERPRLNTGKVLYAPYGGWLQRLMYWLYLR